MHPVGAVLAARLAGIDSPSHRVAFVVTVAAYRHHGKRTIRPGSRLAISSSAFARVEEMRLSCSMIAAPNRIGRTCRNYLFLLPRAVSVSRAGTLGEDLLVSV